jgi:hypothetical protein
MNQEAFATSVRLRPQEHGSRWLVDRPAHGTTVVNR